MSSRYEQALIGTVLVKPTLTGDVSDVRKTDMSSRSHQILWETIISLNNGGRLSPQAVIEKLIADGAMVNLGGDVDDGELVGEEYIRDIMARGAEISVREFADQVINSSVKRSLREVGQLIALDAQGEGEADKIMDEVEKKLIELRRTRVDDGIEIGELLGTFSTRMNQWREGTFIPAMKFHTPGVSTLIPFLEEEDYMICAGRPGEGKSSLMRFEAFKSATLDGKKVAIINLENSDLEYARYFIAFITGINSKKLRDPKLLTDLEIIKVKQAIQELRKAPIKIVSMGSPTVFEIGRVMRKLAKEGYEIFFVDYLQLIQNGAENENANITITSTVLRGYAKIMRRPIIAAAQLNRSITTRTVGGEPELSDLRGSGSLEQDALIVAFPRIVTEDPDTLRNFPQNTENGHFEVRAIPIRIHVRKNRNGPVGKTSPILWDKATNNYYALTNEVG